MIYLSIDHLVLVGLLCAATHWIVARSEIMRWFWSRTTGMFASLLECPACSGFWIGLSLGAAGLRPVAGLHPILETIVTGVLALYLTPIFEGLLVWGLRESAMTVEEEAPPLPLSKIPPGD